MSLNEAVLAIADDMDKDAQASVDGELDGTTSSCLRSYAKQLRNVIRASDGVMKQLAVDPIIQHRQGIDAARAAIRKERAAQGSTKPNVEESSPRMVALGDGVDLIQVPGDMLVGDKTMIHGAEFQLGADGWLHLVEGK